MAYINGNNVFFAAATVGGNKFSNALIGTASGECISIDDLSPIEHNIKIKPLNFDPNIDPVKVIKYDKNYITSNIIKKPADWFSSSDGITVQGYDEVYFSSKSAYKPLTLEGSYLEAGKEYIVSVDVINYELNQYSGEYEIYNSYDVALSYTDLNGRKYESNKLKLNQIGRLQLNFTPTVSGVYNLICFGRSTTSGKVMFTNPQVMLKESVEEYEFDEFVTVDYDKGVCSSLCLTTNSMGAKIECEYNRDINKAFAELQQAIISLGGNV